MPSGNRLPSLLARCAFLLSVIATASQMRAINRVSEPFAGVRYTTRTQTVPRYLSIHIVEIDTTRADISFLVTPSNGSLAGENSPSTVSAFAKKYGLQIAINGTFYSWPSTGGLNNSGIVASKGDVYSPFEGDSRPWPVFNIGEDNFAQIVDPATLPTTGIETKPAIRLYNALSGSERIVTAGKNTGGRVSAGSPTTLNPRTAIGITPDRRIVIVVIDGRQAGFSMGTINTETADLLIQYGVTDAVNLDGGGSSTLVMALPDPRPVNSYSDATERTVSASLGIYAAPATVTRDVIVYADYYGGDRCGFTLAPASAPGAVGLTSASTNTAIADQTAVQRGWIQRLSIKDDPAVTAPAANSSGGWYFAHAWTSTVAADHPLRPARGAIGFRARTRSQGVQVSPSLIDGANRERGTRKALIADGAWHLYEWNVAAAADWQTGAGSNGKIDAEGFNFEALHVYGPDADAVIDIDLVAHNAQGSLNDEFSPTNTGKLANLSVRTTHDSKKASPQLGFILTPPTTSQVRPILLRAIGPSLAPFGVPNVMSDPRLTLRDSQGNTIAGNDNWGGDASLSALFGKLGAFALAGPASFDAAITKEIPPGAYTAQVDGGSGAVLIETYDADHTRPLPLLGNLSTLCSINTPGDTAIVGFVVRDSARRILIRAVGPGLTSFGVASPLADPMLSLYAGSRLQAINEDWGGGPVLTEVFSRTGAFTLAGTSKDAAIVAQLEPGAYTAVVSGAGTATGQVLLELYTVD